jgi:type II secretory pathway component PulF
MVIGVILLGGILFLVFRTEKGKYFLDMLAVNIPLLKNININSQTSRFARAFSLLLSSGMDLNDAMDAVEVILTNRYVREKFRRAADYVRHGMSLTNAFETENIFPSMMIKMITVGERTNSLDEVLGNAYNEYIK